MSNNSINLLMDSQDFIPPRTKDQTVHQSSSSDRPQDDILQFNDAHPSDNLSMIYHQSNYANRNPVVAQNKFYQEFKKIYCIAFNLSQEKKRLKHQIQKMMGKINHSEAIFENEDVKKQLNDENLKDQEFMETEQKFKRSRRTAQTIQKNFKCTGYQCQRSYGTQGSLQQHIKLKHPEIYKKGQQQFSSSSFCVHKNDQQE